MSIRVHVYNIWSALTNDTYKITVRVLSLRSSVIHGARVCSSRALSRLRALFHVGAWCSDPGTRVLSFGFVSGFRTLTLHVLSLCGSVRSRVRPHALLSTCVLLCCTQFVFLSAACIHISCAVWHAACVFHWLRAFMLSCLV